MTQIACVKSGHTASHSISAKRKVRLYPVALSISATMDYTNVIILYNNEMIANPRDLLRRGT